ncbi:hypothetical protein Efla_002354 [Eimeria flavescens]
MAPPSPLSQPLPSHLAKMPPAAPAGDALPATANSCSSASPGSSSSCYLVTMGLRAHVHAETAQAAAAAAADAAASAVTESAPSQSAQISSLYISSVPAQQQPHSPLEYHHPQQQLAYQQDRSPAPQPLQQAPSYCTIHVDSFVRSSPPGLSADSAATEAAIGAVARAAAAEVAAVASPHSPPQCGRAHPAWPVGGTASNLTDSETIVGVNAPDLKTVPIAIRVPPYGEHLVYELRKLRQFWHFEMHQRDWRQVLACSYFPNVIDPLLLTVLRLCCCIFVGVLEVFASIQGVGEVGNAHLLYFTNWNSLMVAAGFISLTITSMIACRSFAAPLRQQRPIEDESPPQQQQQQPRHEQEQQPQSQQQQQQPRHEQQEGQQQQQEGQQQQQEGQQQEQQQGQQETRPMQQGVDGEPARNSVSAETPEQQSRAADTPQQQVRSAGRETSNYSLGFSALEFVATDSNPPRPTYSPNKTALLPRLVQQRQQLLQHQQQPRDTRALCLVLPGYIDLMGDSRYCVEGILLAPNPSNRASSQPPLHDQQQQQRQRQGGTRACWKWWGSSEANNSAIEAEAGETRSPASPGSVAAGSGGRAASGSGPAAGGSRSAADLSPSAAAAAAVSAAPLPWFVKVTWILHNLQLVASLGVFAVFFSLFKAEQMTVPWTWVTIWKHSVLVLLTLLHASLLSRIPCPLRHVGFTLLLFLSYFILQICVFVLGVPNGQGGVGYVYKVFMLKEPLKAVMVLGGILICCLLMHLFLWSISRKRCLYVDPPPSVSVTALQLRRSLRWQTGRRRHSGQSDGRLAAAAAAAAIAASATAAATAAAKAATAPAERAAAMAAAAGAAALAAAEGAAVIAAAATGAADRMCLPDPSTPEGLLHSACSKRNSQRETAWGLRQQQQTPLQQQQHTPPQQQQQTQLQQQNPPCRP